MTLAGSSVSRGRGSHNSYFPIEEAGRAARASRNRLAPQWLPALPEAVALTVHPEDVRAVRDGAWETVPGTSSWMVGM